MRSNEEFWAAIRKNKAYQDLDIDQEIGKMEAWILVHPPRQMTRKFVVNWLNNQISNRPVVYVPKAKDPEEGYELQSVAFDLMASAAWPGTIAGLVLRVLFNTSYFSAQLPLGIPPIGTKGWLIEAVRILRESTTAEDVQKAVDLLLEDEILSLEPVEEEGWPRMFRVEADWGVLGPAFTQAGDWLSIRRRNTAAVRTR